MIAIVKQNISIHHLHPYTVYRFRLFPLSLNIAQVKAWAGEMHPPRQFEIAKDQFD